MCALTVCLALLLGTPPAQAQTSATPPHSATLLKETLTLTFKKGGTRTGIVIVDTPPLVHGFTVDGLGSGSVHPSAVSMDNRTVTLELGKAAEPGQTVTVSYDPDMVPKNSEGLDGWHNPLRYTDGTLVPAFSVSVTALAPEPATGLSVSFVSGMTVDLSWALPAQPAGVSVTAVEVHGTMTEPGVTEVPDFGSYGMARLAADATSQTWPVMHGGHTFYFRVRLVTNAGDADSQIVSWSSDQEYLQPATGLTASNATETTVDLAWTLPEQPAWVAQMPADEVWSEVRQQEADGTWSTVAKLAVDAAAHTVTGLSAGTAYSFRIDHKDTTTRTDTEPVSVTTLVGPLTASFHDVPSEHDGESEFNFELRFSDDLVRALSSATLRDKALQATNATVTRAKRVVKRENRLWTITVRPHSAEAVTVSLPATTDCAAAGALCTPDGRPLSNATTATVAAHQWAGTPLESATLLGTALTLTFGKPVVIGATELLVHGFTVDGISNSGSVHPSAMAMDNRTATLELGMGAEPGQTVTVSYDPDKVPNTRPEPGYPEGRHEPLRYTDGTLVAAFSGVPVTVGPEPATGLSVSFESGKTAKVSWTLPAQPAGVSVTAVELWWDRTEPGVTEVPDLRRVNRLSGDDWTWQPWDVRHGGFTDYFRVRLVTNFGDVDSQVVSWTSDQEGLKPATGLTASNATQTTVDLAWTLPTEQPEWVTQVAGDFWTEVQQQVADGGWSEVARPAGDALAHTVTGLSAGTAYSFRIRLGFNTGPAYSEPVSVTTEPVSVTGVSVVSSAGADKTYGDGDKIEVRVTFDGPVDVTGTPRLKIDMDPADWGEKVVPYERGGGSSSLIFTHTVVEPNLSTQGIAVLANTLELNGGTIRSGGNDADLAHDGLDHDPNHKVDWQAAPEGGGPGGQSGGEPASVTGVSIASDPGADQTYMMGDKIRIVATFSETVSVTGTPRLKIDMDPAHWGEKWVPYERSDGANGLIFTHTVVEPNFSTQGIAVLANTLELNGGTIRSGGNDADLAHDGLAHDAGHKVDWRLEVSVADASATEAAGATVAFAVTLSRAVTGAEHQVRVDYATADGTATAGSDYTAASGTLTFAAGETSKTVSVQIFDDSHDEGEETFTLRLSNATGPASATAKRQARSRTPT